MDKHKRMGCMIGVISGIAIVIGLIFLFLFDFPTSSRNLAKYETLLSERKNLRTGFVVFPSHIPASGMENEPDFYYFYQNTLFDPTAEVYLRCTYSDADYRAELERLEHYAHTPDRDDCNEPCEAQSFLKDEQGRFSYPAYLAILADDHAYEYALLTGEREITYVYFAFQEPGDFRAVPEDCLPFPFIGYLDREHGMYNIYMFQEHGEQNYYIVEYDRCTSE